MSDVAFVAGATGYAGREVVRALRARGARVHAHVRPDSARLAEWRERFGELGAVIDVSPWDAHAITGTISRIQPTHVFALLGTTRARARAEPGASYETVDYGLTHTLIQATTQAAPDALFVYLSALGARAGARSAYLAVRGRIEQELQTSTLRHLVARPALITGPDRDDRRPAEQLAARIVDAALSAARSVGARSIHASYASLTGREVGEGLAILALAGTTGVVGPRELRRAASPAPA